MQRFSRLGVGSIAILLMISYDAGAALMNWRGTATVILYDEHEPNVYFYGGGVATVNGTSGVVPAHLDSIRLGGQRGRIGGTYTHYITDPDAMGQAVAAIRFGHIEPRTGTVDGTSPYEQIAGEIPVDGLVQACILSSACTMYIPLELIQSFTSLGREPLEDGAKGIGIGGLLTMGGFGEIRFSVQAAPWTINTASVSNIVSTPGGSYFPSPFALKGWRHGPASGTTSTAQPGGGLQLVTPIRTWSNLPLGIGRPLGHISTLMGTLAVLKIEFIPEPGYLLLVLSGVGGLVWMARLRR